VFARSASGWDQQGDKLTGGGENGDGSFGFSVALAADGATALIGGPDDSGSKGAAWVFGNAPQAASGGGSGSTTTTTAGGGTATTGTTSTAIVARVVSAKALRHGKQRTLEVRIRVSRPAKARLDLLSGKTAKLKKTFTVKGGANDLKAPVPSGVKKGTYKARITLTATNARSAVYTVTVRVPR
jgi:hypothetical protein